MIEQGSEWTTVSMVDDCADGCVLKVQVNGRDIALYNVAGAFFATDNVCSHAYALLSDGFLEGFEIECPLHFGRFDVRSGKGLCEPITKDIRTYEARIVGDEIQVCMP